jgi:hypothetical protein
MIPLAAGIGRNSGLLALRYEAGFHSISGGVGP